MCDGYYSSYIYVLIPLILSIWASSKVNSTFNRYSKVFSARGYTAAQVTRMILDNAGLRHVGVERVSGNLTDHFDPRGNVIRFIIPPRWRPLVLRRTRQDMHSNTETAICQLRFAHFWCRLQT